MPRNVMRNQRGAENDNPRWPFPVVPDREFCTFLAGRSALQEDLGGPIRTLADRGRTFRHSAALIHS